MDVNFEHKGQAGASLVQGSARLRTLIKASGLAILVDALLIGTKYLFAFLTGSQVFVADALHSGGDLAVSLVVLCSIVIHHLHREHRWLKHTEAVVSLLISMALIVGSSMLLWDGVTGEAERFVVNRGIPLVAAIGGMTVLLFVTIAMSRFKRLVGESCESQAFCAEGTHTYADFLTSFSVFATLCLAYFGIHVERFMALLLGLIVLRVGFNLLYRTIVTSGIVPVIVRFCKTSLSRSARKKLRRLRKRFLPSCPELPRIRLSFPMVREEWIFSNRKRLLLVNIVLVCLFYIGTGVYQVQPHQTGLELLFGKVVKENGPGLHLHAPQPFGAVVYVDTGLSHRLESGFRTQTNFQGEEPEVYLWEFMHTDGRYVKNTNESIGLTGDEYLADVNFLCYYKILDPTTYALKTENAHEILRSIFVHKVHAELNRHQLDSLLTVQRGLVQENLLKSMQDAVRELPLGVEVSIVYMREAHPPIDVVSSYRSVVSSQEEQQRMIHDAHSYKNATIPLSQGKAESIIAKAEASSVEKIYAAMGKAESFQARQEAFDLFEAVQKKRLWWSAVESALAGKQIVVLPQGVRRRISTNTVSVGGYSNPVKQLIPQPEEQEMLE